MKYILSLIFITSLILPVSAEARHRSSGVDRSDLDDDIVEDIRIPVLFGVEYDEVFPDFGDPRGDGTRSHEGQDMLAPLSTPIVSPTEAIVIRTGEGTSAGKYVYTANPGGETFRYMHLDTIADIERGDTLDIGDFIGTVGDTGNAPDGVYHLHFEMRDEDNDAQDPYPRLVGDFSLKEKISFLEDVFRDIDDEEDYATFLVKTFDTEFRQAVQLGYDMPDEIEDALEAAGIYSVADLQKQLDNLVASIPMILDLELRKGTNSTAVSLLQLYLIYSLEGPEQIALLGAGPTGYYGSITEAAVLVLQADVGVLETGVYDVQTRKKLID